MDDPWWFVASVVGEVKRVYPIREDAAGRRGLEEGGAGHGVLALAVRILPGNKFRKRMGPCQGKTHTCQQTLTRRFFVVSLSGGRLPP